MGNISGYPSLLYYGLSGLTMKKHKHNFHKWWIANEKKVIISIITLVAIAAILNATR